MNVLNHERKAFRDMTQEERSAIVEEIIADNAEIWNWETKKWQDNQTELIAIGCIYRTRPRKLVIPWEHIKEEYLWAAMDEFEGNIYFYKVKPKLGHESWDGGVVGTASALNIDTAGIDWRESLTARPEGV